ncbi:MAG: SpoIIE family protein phosphatase [Bacteroidales bacterium]
MTNTVNKNPGHQISYVALIPFMVFLLISGSTSAQDGGLFLTHFAESRQTEDQNWAICQDNYDIMLFANRRGVVTFDGYNWDLIRLPVIPYSMVYNSSDERVYIGGENGYGYLQRNANGIYNYISIDADSAFRGVVTGITLTDTLLYVLTPECLAVHSLPDLQQNDLLSSGPEQAFASLFSTPQGVFLSIWSTGLCKLEGDELIPLITGYMTAYDEILFALPYDSIRVLVGLGSNSIHLFDGLEFYRWEPVDEGYLEQKLLAGGHLINDTLYLFSTIEGGVIVVGRASKKVYHTINYERGLPDNEVFATGSDNNGGLWMSHEFGLTRADLTLPVSNFGIYQGLKGNLISAVWYNDKLYAGTSDGLYLLSEVKRYETEEVLRRVPVRRQIVKAPVEPEPLIEIVPVPKQEVLQPERRSIFDRIFGKITGKKQSEEVEETVPEKKPVESRQVAVEPPLPAYRYVTRTVSRLSSVRHEFRSVTGIAEKCKQLVATPDGLLVGTNRGLYQVRESVAVPVVTGVYVNHISSATPEGRHYVATGSGWFSVIFQNGEWKANIPFPAANRTFYSVAVDSDASLWFGAENSLVRICNHGQPESSVKEYRVASDFVQRYHVEYMRDTLFMFTETGIYYHDSVNDDLVALPGYEKGNQPYRYIFTENGNPWIFREGFPFWFGTGEGWTREEQSLLRLFQGIGSISSSGKRLWITDEANRIIRIDPTEQGGIINKLDLYIGGTRGPEEPFFGIEGAEFARGQRVVQFSFVSPYYINQNAVQYRYRIEGLTDGWTEWSSNPVLTLFPKPGSYTLTVMSRAVTGLISSEKTLEFWIRPGITETSWFYIIVVFVLLISVFAMMRMREKKLVHDKYVLEQKVMERTARIAAQKQEITSSIAYASRIQHAMLSEVILFKNSFSDHFIFFRPRDIVSGDFFWIAGEGGRVFFTAADCTGHGVPGAFMSMLGISSLNDIINSDTTLSASQVLGLLRERVKISLKQTGREGEAADGIDMALCIYDPGSSTVEFAAAYNSMLHFRGSKMSEYRGDRMPIGIFYGEKPHFRNHIVKINRGDAIYLFTDGFADQFGGPDQTKYKVKNLKMFLSSVKELPMVEQKRLIEEEFERWKGEQEQVDDVTVIGIRF